MKKTLLVLSMIFVGCQKNTETPISPETFLIESGDIVVANNMSDAILLLNSSGEYKAVLYNVKNTDETVWGLSWDSEKKEVIATIDGLDRVVAIDRKNGEVRTAITNTNLSGTPLRGVMRIPGGDYLVAEDNFIERFNSQGIRIANAWPKSLLNGNSQISPLKDGGFLLCSGNTSRTVAKYSNEGVLIASKSFASSTLDVTGCLELLDGTIAVNLNHATNTNDRIEIYAADLTGSALMSYSDNTNIANPTGLAQRANGNLIVSDTTFHHLIEISLSGQLVGILSDSVTQSPIQILVIP